MSAWLTPPYVVPTVLVLLAVAGWLARTYGW